jgi:putative restriction endonuclease
VWTEFERDPESTVFEAEKLHAETMQQPLRISDSLAWEHIQGTDIATVTKVRVNQHFFRSLVVTGYKSQCAVCDLPFPSLLVAAHIVPWSVDRSLRMNPRNGICLCSLHDRAFDKGLLTIDANYSIDIHTSIKEASKIDAVVANFLRFVGRPLSLPDRWLPDPELLRRHNALVS